jgi:hypothetical protein
VRILSEADMGTTVRGRMRNTLEFFLLERRFMNLSLFKCVILKRFFPQNLKPLEFPEPWSNFGTLA